ncbi:SusC/RagA family TonB-linked outer membrane protein [Arcicella rigui]|uniref:SusC/RagA family TonB-linked outer membrane protein n=1 Tax=Arcicella rigui TaxID=797020 RepID=A0ABU5Q677_9BACT|nr:SusC/RagA family TonB-linked outer membrane protein [Arcicella rigui]MEA5138325.1 SusC/RagA family TonB-linked outer membrane protein [Arcicella rigui]
MRKFLLITSVLLLALIGQTFAQDRQITGKVVSAEDDSPLPGVSIVVKGTSRGTTTTANGTYKISVPNGATLTFSFVGFDSKSIAVGSQSVINVSLGANTSQLQEVVVTALGVTRQKESLGYSTTSVKGGELNQAKAVSVASALQGKVSGLQINTVNNGVNPSNRVVLRGNRSLLGNNEALIVVDGTVAPSDVLNYLNPNDIDDVTVLKGANAAALYGSDASNGALIITTKKGSVGAPKISVSNTTYIEEISFMPKLQERFGSGTESYSRTYIPFENQSYGPEYTTGDVLVSGAGIQKGTSVDLGMPLEDGTIQKTSYTNKANSKLNSYDKGVTTQSAVSLSVGDKASTFFISAQQNNTKAIVPGDTKVQTTIRTNASHEYGKFKGAFNIGYTSNTIDFTTSDFYNNVLNTGGQVPLDQYRNWRDFKNADGSLNYAHPNNYYNAYFYSPFFFKDVNRRKEVNTNLTGNVELSYKATSWLSFLGRVGITKKDYNGKAYQEKFRYSDYAKSVADFSEAQNDLNGFNFDYNSSESRLSSDFFLTAEKKIGKFSGTLIAGINNKETTQKFVNATANSLVIPGLYNVTNRIGEAGASASDFKSRLFGAYADLSVTYNNYLSLHVSGRNDWSSLLSKANRSFFYPGADLSLVLTEAVPALKELTFLNFAKVRLAATKVGGINVGPYALQTTFGTGNFPYGSLAGYSVGNTLPDPNLTPEFTNSYEIGGEFGFLNNRVNLEVAYYTQKTTGQTVSISTSQATGYNSALINAGTVQNSGFELDLKTTPVKLANGFKWDFNINFSQVDNKVLELYQGINELNLSNYYGLTSDASLGQVFATVGEQYPVIKVVAYKRDPEGRVIVNSQTGYPTVATGLKTIGQSNPKYRLGLTTNLKYKGFGLNAVAEYRGGNYVYHGLASTMWFTGVASATASYGRERFVFPNSVIQNADGTFTPNTTVTVKDGGLGAWDSNLRRYGENFVTSAAFWKLREIAFTYDVPKSVLSSTKFIKSASVGIVGRNLITLLPKENLYTDPEFANTTSNAVGLNNTGQTPPTRTYGFTVNLGF